MIRADKPELEKIVRDAADGLIAAWDDAAFSEELARDAIGKLIAAEAQLAAESDRSADLGVFKLCEISGGIGLLIGWLAGRFL